VLGLGGRVTKVLGPAEMLGLRLGIPAMEAKVGGGLGIPGAGRSAQSSAGWGARSFDCHELSFSSQDVISSRFVRSILLRSTWIDCTPRHSSQASGISCRWVIGGPSVCGVRSVASLLCFHFRG
jgi:hypothetical protein